MKLEAGMRYIRRDGSVSPPLVAITEGNRAEYWFNDDVIGCLLDSDTGYIFDAENEVEARIHPCDCGDDDCPRKSPFDLMGKVEADAVNDPA